MPNDAMKSKQKEATSKLPILPKEILPGMRHEIFDVTLQTCGYLNQERLTLIQKYQLPKWHCLRKRYDSKKSIFSDRLEIFFF